MTFVPVPEKSPTRHKNLCIPLPSFSRQCAFYLRSPRAFLAFAAAVPLFLPLAGCGGGGMGSPGPAAPAAAATPPPAAPAPAAPAPAAPAPASAPPPVSSTPTETGAPFVPNYSTELRAARHWDKSAVTVAFIPPAADAGGHVPDVGPTVRAAIDLWNGKVGQEVQLHLVDANAAADITIRWTPFNDLPADAVGLTEVRYRSADEILSSASVRIQESLPDSFQVQVLAHELGHSLGIDGHSGNGSDLMYPNAHLPAAITTRDQNTVLLSYHGRGVIAGRAQSRNAANGSGAPGAAETTVVRYVCGSGR
jgi:hypothetical protein